MIQYLEEFRIDALGTTVGIEDQGATLKKQRYKCWSGGCGIGGHPTLAAARKDLHNFVRTRLLDAHALHLKKMCDASDAINLIGDDPVFLFRFETPDSKKLKPKKRA